MTKSNAKKNATKLKKINLKELKKFSAGAKAPCSGPLDKGLKDQDRK